MKMLYVVPVLACVLLLSFSWCCAGPGPGAGGRPAPDPIAGSGREASDLALGSDDGARTPSAAAPGAEAAPVAEPSFGNDELLRHLRGVARGFVAHDMRAIEEHVEALLGRSGTAPEVLRRLVRDAFRSEVEAQTGAVLFLGLALARAGRGDGRSDLDAGAFTLEVLRALPELHAPVDDQLAEFLASLEVGDRRVIGARYLVAILALRAGRPERAGVFDPILESLIADGDELALLEADVPELALVFAQSHDPLAVRAALSALLAADPKNFLAIAEDAFRHSRNDPILRGAISRAIAERAPIDEAVRSLARIADSSQYPQFDRLGAREGGLAQIQAEYNRLIASESDARARKMLVSAMGSEKDSVLLGIAETDPSADVRHQALLTMTLKPVEGEGVLRTLRGARAAAKDPRTGLSTPQQITVAGNLALNSKGGVRDGALALLREIAMDPTEALVARQAAYRELASRLPREELAGIPMPR